MELRPVLVDTTMDEMAIGTTPHRFTLLDSTSLCSPVRVLQEAGMVENRLLLCRLTNLREVRVLHSLGSVPASRLFCTSNVLRPVRAENEEGSGPVRALLLRVMLCRDVTNAQLEGSTPRSAVLTKLMDTVVGTPLVHVTPVHTGLQGSVPATQLL